MIRPDWRECPKDNVVGQWTALYVTMNPLGEIAMSRFTYERMAAPKAFVLLFDASNNRIGLKPAALTTRNAYPVRVHGREAAKRSAAIASCRNFRSISSKHYTSKTPTSTKTVRYPRPANGTGFDEIRRLSACSVGGVASEI